MIYIPRTTSTQALWHCKHDDSDEEDFDEKDMNELEFVNEHGAVASTSRSAPEAMASKLPTPRPAVPLGVSTRGSSLRSAGPTASAYSKQQKLMKAKPRRDESPKAAKKAFEGLKVQPTQSRAKGPKVQPRRQNQGRTKLTGQRPKCEEKAVTRAVEVANAFIGTTFGARDREENEDEERQHDDGDDENIERDEQSFAHSTQNLANEAGWAADMLARKLTILDPHTEPAKLLHNVGNRIEQTDSHESNSETRDDGFEKPELEVANVLLTLTDPDVSAEVSLSCYRL